MKRLITTLIVLTVSLTLMSAATADDAADVKAAVLKLDEAFNAGDVEVISEYLSGRSLFNFRGRLLNVAEGFDKDGLKSAFEAGLKFDRSWKHLDVKVYGNAAVVTGYHGGRTTRTNGSFIQGTRRVSEFWIKQSGTWKQVHRHASQLESALREEISPPEATNGQ